jgi:dCMP deaminase
MANLPPGFREKTRQLPAIGRAIMESAPPTRRMRAGMNGWDRKFIEMAVLVSSWSKDPSTKVGCVIADSDHAQLSEGFNGFPRGIADDSRLQVREMKYRLIVHAEANAIAAAARNGHSLKGATAYVTFSPCPQCAALLVQAGIVRVVTIKGATPAHWLAECEIAQAMLREAGVTYEEAERSA